MIQHHDNIVMIILQVIWYIDTVQTSTDCSTVHWVQYNIHTVQYSTIQLPGHEVRYTGRYWTLIHTTEQRKLQYCTYQYSIQYYSTVQFCTVQGYNVLAQIRWTCTALYSCSHTVQYSNRCTVSRQPLSPRCSRTLYDTVLQSERLSLWEIQSVGKGYCSVQYSVIQYSTEIQKFDCTHGCTIHVSCKLVQTVGYGVCTTGSAALTSTKLALCLWPVILVKVLQGWSTVEQLDTVLYNEKCTAVYCRCTVWENKYDTDNADQWSFCSSEIISI